ncbi:MAG: hypothetical protein IT290_00280, partial [Deltaproteobacteria bacterium]|nr:hypothetical protein [Deltaproteobacteria bacterium]
LAPGGALGATVGLLRAKPRRYGGLIVHAGVAVMAIAIVASTAYKIEKDLSIAVGQETVVGPYTLKLVSLSHTMEKNYEALHATIGVYDAKSGALLDTLLPERRFYPRSEETTTEVDIRMSFRDDLYVALAGLDLAGAQGKVPLTSAIAVLKVFVNPLQIWLWLGSLIVFFGTLVVVIPRTTGLAMEAMREERATVPT